MRIAVGYFYQESTTFNPFVMNTSEFTFSEGDACKKRISAVKVLEELGAEVVPTIFASAISGGCVTRDTYQYYSDKIVGILKKEKVDGVWLHLHGSMEVEGMGSAEADLLKRIREVIPENIPISLVVDLHANLHDDVPKYANIIRSYRTAPHVDQEECEAVTARLLVDCVNREASVTPVFKRVMMITPGEKSTTDTEPMKTILAKAAEYEKMEGIMQVNYINGHAWTDRPNTSASVVVVPRSDAYREKACKIADELAAYAFSRRKDFVFHQLVMGADEAIERAVREENKPVFITDSGDNSTGGAPGINTLMLKKLLQLDLAGKKVLVAAIRDKKTCENLMRCNEGEYVVADVGVNYDENSAAVRVEGILKAKGDLLGYYSSKNDVTGQVCTISMGNVDVAIATGGDSFTTINHFTKAGLCWTDYDIIIVKQGYLFVELTEVAKLHIMALTPGACDLMVENLEFHHLLRPMYPLDKDV